MGEGGGWAQDWDLPHRPEVLRMALKGAGEQGEQRAPARDSELQSQPSPAAMGPKTEHGPSPALRFLNSKKNS